LFFVDTIVFMDSLHVTCTTRFGLVGQFHTNTCRRTTLSIQGQAAGTNRIRGNDISHTHRQVKQTTRTPAQEHREKLHKHQQERGTTAALVNIPRIFWQYETQEMTPYYTVYYFNININTFLYKRDIT
jgi:F0F1-type ATP synthase gamma subunit